MKDYIIAVTSTIPYTVSANSTVLITNYEVEIPEGYELISKHGIPAQTGSNNVYCYNTTRTYIQLRNISSSSVSSSVTLVFLCVKSS